MRTNEAQLKNPKTQETKGERLILKYNGRKFYDTGKPGVVTLAEILVLAKKGLKLRVYSRGNKRDVTIKTLLRAMEMYTPKKLTIKSVEKLLHQAA
jgi:polyhydroxyalkanoate synthesis regulator protein